MYFTSRCWLVSQCGYWRRIFSCSPQGKRKRYQFLNTLQYFVLNKACLQEKLFHWSHSLGFYESLTDPQKQKTQPYPTLSFHVGKERNLSLSWSSFLHGGREITNSYRYQPSHPTQRKVMWRENHLWNSHTQKHRLTKRLKLNF